MLDGGRQKEAAMTRRTRVIIGVAALGAVAVAWAGVAVATNGDDDGGDVPITGDALARASAAALQATGGGRVTGTEVGDEESYYEVEVTLTDGSQVDVQLDRSFHVVSSDADDDRGEDGSNDD
jgi:uncharacterized membrane protein YkoI